MGSLIRIAAISLITALVAVSLVYTIADSLSGPLMAAQPGSDESTQLTLANAVGATFFGGIIGTILAFVVSRLKRSVQIFAGICLVGLVLYGVVAYNAADDTTTGLWLNIMHLTAAIPIVGGLARWLSTATGRTPQ